ncbi:MAG: hypothetical protein J1G01_05745 [Clostridiales bacterium]|nr:hypothetical protein [Clostridiales bacterium]
MTLKISDRTVRLICPVCGSDNFNYLNGISFDDMNDSDTVQCAMCKQTFTKEQILEANQDSIDAEIEAMQDEAISQVVKELNKAFKKFK